MDCKKCGLFKGQQLAFAIVFLEPNPTGLPIASILCTSEYILYWKLIASANIEDIFLYMQSEIKLEEKFSENTIRYQDKYLKIYFFKQQQLEKQLLIKAKGILITYKVLVYNQFVKEKYLLFLTKAIKRTYNE
ncbi:22603_t:CDS:1, partial [Gigaspora rosea]